MTSPQNPTQTPEDSLETIIYMAIGEASMCWSEIPKGVFDSSKAKEIAKRVIDAVRASRPAPEAKRSAEEPEATALERAKDAVIEAARKFCAVRVCTHFSEEEIEKQKQGCLHPLLEALAALDKLEGK